MLTKSFHGTIAGQQSLGFKFFSDTTITGYVTVTMTTPDDTKSMTQIGITKPHFPSEDPESPAVAASKTPPRDEATLVMESLTKVYGTGIHTDGNRILTSEGYVIMSTGTLTDALVQLVQGTTYASTNTNSSLTTTILAMHDAALGDVNVTGEVVWDNADITAFKWVADNQYLSLFEETQHPQAVAEIAAHDLVYEGGDPLVDFYNKTAAGLSFVNQEVDKVIEEFSNRIEIAKQNNPDGVDILDAQIASLRTVKSALQVVDFIKPDTPLQLVLEIVGYKAISGLISLAPDAMKYALKEFQRISPETYEKIVPKATSIISKSADWFNYVNNFGQTAAKGIDESLERAGKYAFEIEGSGTNMKRVTSIDGKQIKINSGHAYDRVHLSGDLRVTGITRNEFESAILEDLPNEIRFAVQGTDTDISLNVKGTIIIYRLRNIDNVSFSINYFPL